MKRAKNCTWDNLFSPQVNAFTILISHIGPSLSVVTVIILSSEAHSRDKNEFHTLPCICAKF